MASLDKSRNQQVIAAEHGGLWMFFAKLYYPVAGGQDDIT